MINSYIIISWSSFAKSRASTLFLCCGDMNGESLQDTLLGEITPVVEGLGCSIVEFKTARQRDRLIVHLVVYKQGGISISECSEVHKLVQPRIEVITGVENIHMEVSSPGISRKIKAVSEYAVFRGKGIKILTIENDWITGIIEDTDEKMVTLKQEDKVIGIPYHDIRKAKLDYTQEVE